MFPKLMQLEREPSINPVCICLPLQLCWKPWSLDHWWWGKQWSGGRLFHWTTKNWKAAKHVGWVGRYYGFLDLECGSDRRVCASKVLNSSHCCCCALFSGYFNKLHLVCDKSREVLLTLVSKIQLSIKAVPVLYHTSPTACKKSALDILHLILGRCFALGGIVVVPCLANWFQTSGLPVTGTC